LVGALFGNKRNFWRKNDCQERARQTKIHEQAENQKSPAGNPQKKKASWLRTILWMLSMMLLVNVFFAVLV